MPMVGIGFFAQKGANLRGLILSYKTNCGYGPPKIEHSLAKKDGLRAKLVSRN